MNWLYGISITCFAASYLVAFCLELTRVFFRAPLRKFLITGIILAGFFAHTIYMVLQTQIQVAGTGLFMGSWSGWCFGAAWVLIIAYLWIRFRQPETLAGLFVLPMVVCLIAVGTAIGPDLAFPSTKARTVWNAVHGLSLLVGTASVFLGFVFGVMYLLQSRRLKKKLPPSRRVRFPSLEWLQESSEMLLLVSMVLLGVGLLSGIIVNLINQRMDEGVVPWNDPVIVSSGLLFTWLLIATLFNLYYRPARQGRKVAYLVLASFIFLIVEIGIVLSSGHAIREHSLDNDTSVIKHPRENFVATNNLFRQGGLS